MNAPTSPNKSPARNVWTFCLLALIVSLGLAAAISPFASSKPDGLEWVAEKHEFADKGEGEPVYNAAPMPEYTTPGVPESKPWLSTGLAGLIGTVIVFVVALALAWVLAVRRKHPTSPAETP